MSPVPFRTEREMIRSPLPLTTYPASHMTQDDKLSQNLKTKFDFQDVASPQDSGLRRQSSRDQGKAISQVAKAQVNEGSSKKSGSLSKPSDEDEKALSTSSIQVYIEEAQQIRQNEE